MDNHILSRVRKLNWLLQEAPKGKFSFNDLCSILSELMDSNVYLANPKGRILGNHLKIEEDKTTITDEKTGGEFFSEDYSKELLKIQSTTANVRDEEILSIFKDDVDTQNKYHTFIPVVCGGVRWGTLLITRYFSEYSDEDLVLGEVGATAVGLEMQRLKNIRLEEEQRSEAVVKMAFDTLSYSENEAVQRIFQALQKEEGILVASKIADKSRITRSVIVNALRKLESAGVIETKSLGMKGTYIKVLNKKFYDYLND